MILDLQAGVISEHPNYLPEAYNCHMEIQVITHSTVTYTGTVDTNTIKTITVDIPLPLLTRSLSKNELATELWDITMDPENNTGAIWSFSDQHHIDIMRYHL